MIGFSTYTSEVGLDFQIQRLESQRGFKYKGQEVEGFK